MRLNGGTTMAAVTWRYVPPGTCHVPPREPFEKCCVRQGCSPNGKGPGAQTFRSEAPWSELCAIRRISPEGSKLCPPRGRYCFFFSLMPSSSDTLKVECLLTSAIWSYGHEAEVYIFLNLPFPSNPKENFSIRCILSTPEQNLL